MSESHLMRRSTPILDLAVLAMLLAIIFAVTCSLASPATAATQSPLKIPNHVNFGNQALGTTTEQIITLTNRSSDVVSVFGIGVSAQNGGFSFDFASNQCVGITLQPGESCTYGITFSPLIAGRLTGQSDISFASPAGGETALIALSGRGTS
jgi:Abnormal spindle-like microcephaly-assoc'd, ASPM-SPD-2-Hydin